ncbi:MAG TPA: hypothetical protein VMT00_07000 [Thermoanaerobaculia bacterium]|nr:hypothetical protein [Thermoanaerobaculia bacterium]
MIGTVLALLIALMFGIVLTAAFGLRVRPGMFFGISLLLGISLIGFTMFLLSLLHIPWSRSVLLVSLVVITAAVALSRRSIIATELDGLLPRMGLPSWAMAIDATILLTLWGYAIYATIAPNPQYDFIVLWGLKARAFWHARGIDWDFLHDPLNIDAHVDYPLHLPLMLDGVWVLQGGWDDRWIGLLFVAIAAGVVLVIRGVLLEELDSPYFGRFAALAMMPAALVPWVGMAEGPLIAYGTSGALFLRRGLRLDDRSSIVLGSVLLGFAGLMKNEGLAIVAAAMVGYFATRRGRARPFEVLLPAIAIVGSWLVVQRVMGFRSELLTDGPIDRLLLHLRELPIFIEAVMGNPLGKRLFWIGALVAILARIRIVLRDERLLASVVALQFLAYIGVYMITPYSLAWHLETSWERVLNLIVLPLAFLAFTQLAPALGVSTRSQAPFDHPVPR